MDITFFKNTILLALLVCFSCGSQTKEKNDSLPLEVMVGAAQFSEYLPTLTGKNVGVVANQTSVVGSQHLVDLLIEKNISVKKVFAPEHGFRGKADAGELVKDGVDTKTGLQITSLHGKRKNHPNKNLKV